MRLKSLQISGFKSFCHPVKIDFIQKGITVVVGPNGCGKSNVADAILWVLGEQSAKHLRGGGMEDVIFAGSDFQKPTGVAEVTLTFNNLSGLRLPKYQEFSEISVSRKLYRSGESVYLINKIPVRLMDVRELFMDTGIGSKSYAIIEQGKIGEIVGAKPLERRFLIEEAAGIVKFKTKRQTAEKRLESTQQNLLRIGDLLQEIRRQEELLQEQVEKANRYSTLKAESQQIDQQLSTFRWQKAWQQEKAADAKTETHKESQNQLLVNRHLQEKNLAALSQQLAQQGSALERLREEVFQKERTLQENENKRTLEQQNLSNYEEWMQQHAQEWAELQKKASLLQEQFTTTHHEIQQLETNYQILQKEADQIETTRKEESDILHALTEAMQTFQKRLLALHTQQTNQTNQQGFLKERLNLLQERRLRLQSQSLANQEQLLRTQNKQTQTEQTIETLKTQQEDGQQRLQSLAIELKTHTEALTNNEKTLKAQQYQQQSLLSHLESLKSIQDQYEDFDESVKSFLSLLREAPAEKKQLGILGALAEFLTVDSKSLPEVAPALVDYLNLVLVESSENFPAIERFCTEKKTGRLGFIALNRLPSVASSPPKMGLPLSDFLHFDSCAVALSEGFFSQVYLIQNEDTWQTLTLIENHIDWISPQGSYYGHQGIVKMGQPRSASFGFLERKGQIETLATQTEALQTTVDTLQKEQQRLKQQFVASNEKIDVEKRQLHEGELELSRYHKELEHDQLECQRALEMRGQLQSDQDQTQKEMAKNQQSQQELKEASAQMEQERHTLETQMAQKKDAIHTQQQTIETIAEKLLKARISLTETFEKIKNAKERQQRLEKEKNEARTRLITLENSQGEITQKLKKSQQIIVDIDSNFTQLLESKDQLKQQLADQTALQHQMTEKRSQASLDLQALAKELDQLMNQIHKENLQATEQRMKREQIEHQLTQTYGRSPAEMSQQWNLENLNEHQLAGKLKKLHHQMEGMAQVNLGAPQEYAAVQERIEFLEQQSADLQQAMDDLRQSIREINLESRRRFQETFAKVNEHFKELFFTLFEGGKAEMVLTPAADVLEAGIDIIAQPPGKKLQHLNLLSGGEKALTAISLIFAIFLIKPSPFCLLDEVDAPLDEANVSRFNLIIQKLLENSQFIIITHNKKTMAGGHRLYGVTMEEPGISKMVSVEFQQAAEMAV